MYGIKENDLSLIQYPKIEFILELLNITEAEDIILK